MKSAIYIAAMLLGAAIGTALVRTSDRSSIGMDARDGSSLSMIEKSSRPPEAVGVRVSRMISAATPAMREDIPIDKATDLLFAERKSPMRTRAFLKNRIQTMTREQLVQSFMNGEIQTMEEIEEGTRRLASDDPELTFNQLASGDLKLYGMDNIYKFTDTLLQTWADVDAPAVMTRLQKMERGGSQQDTSLRFSKYWAKIDPAAAARNFSDLIYLRNMQDQGDMIFTDKRYADEIVKSWKQKDEEAMRKYIADLPAGRERAALEAAAGKHDPNTR